ncbi:MAG TPA: CehA/McbA family metallohydrolase [bacterium]
MIDLRPEFFLPVFLYAETHYKFKGIYSRLFKNEPEIIADAPFRVEPGQAIPILLLIKDAHRFPIEIQNILIEITQAGKSISKKSISLNQSINTDRFWHRIFYIERPKDIAGSVAIDVQIIIKTHGKLKKYHNDNYRISSHQPLKVYLAKDPLPRFDNWHFGDFHFHSNYTEDQVEFGAPLEATVEIARAIGLNFFAVTDHSYDLDDQEDSWVHNDHTIPKWHRLWQEAENLNRKHADFVILPGEEVSAGNHQKRNVHLLVLNNRAYFPGQGDSAERWFRTKPDLSIDQVLNQVAAEALAIAGHPEIPTPFLQWLLIQRGRWQWQDFQHSRLDGFQIWNGEYDRSFNSGSEIWVKLLLEGKKLSLIAGNDAHGNFNRFLQIGFPFFTFRENYSQLFGNMRTAVKIAVNLSVSEIIQAVKKNHVLVSNGPVLDVHLYNEIEQYSTIGDEIEGKNFKIKVTAKSTEEFGRLESLQLFFGNLASKQEISLLRITTFSRPYDFSMEQLLPYLSETGYLRLELDAKKSDGSVSRCLSNPIWFKYK